MKTKNGLQKMGVAILTGVALMALATSGYATVSFCLYNKADCPANETIHDGNTCSTPSTPLQLRCHLSGNQIPCLYNANDCPAAQGGKTGPAPTCSTNRSCTFSV